jgi:hypothetical protein
MRVTTGHLRHLTRATSSAALAFGRHLCGRCRLLPERRRGSLRPRLTAKLQRYGWDLDRTSWTRIELGERIVSDCELVAIAGDQQG